MDMGGYVVVINAEQVLVTGNKFNQKLYRRHTTGRPGSMKIETFKDLQAVSRQHHEIRMRGQSLVHLGAVAVLSLGLSAAPVSAARRRAHGRLVLVHLSTAALAWLETRWI